MKSWLLVAGLLLPGIRWAPLPPERLSPPPSLEELGEVAMVLPGERLVVAGQTLVAGAATEDADWRWNLEVEEDGISLRAGQRWLALEEGEVVLSDERRTATWTMERRGGAWRLRATGKEGPSWLRIDEKGARLRPLASQATRLLPVAVAPAYPVDEGRLSFVHDGRTLWMDREVPRLSVRPYRVTVVAPDDRRVDPDLPASNLMLHLLTDAHEPPLYALRMDVFHGHYDLTAADSGPDLVAAGTGTTVWTIHATPDGQLVQGCAPDGCRWLALRRHRPRMVTDPHRATPLRFLWDWSGFGKGHGPNCTYHSPAGEDALGFDTCPKTHWPEALPSCTFALGGRCLVEAELE